jgi:hypothetical protein
MTAFGDLRLVASARIDGAGPFEGQPLLFHWPWYWHLPGLGPWLLLALAVGVPKRNRDRRALLIFVPLAILSLLWPVIAQRVRLPSASLDLYSLLFESLVVGLALLWLNSDKLSEYNRRRRFLMSLGILVLAGLVAMISSGRTPLDPLVIILLILVIPMGVILLAALATARRMTHGQYAPLPFMAWLAAASLLLWTVATILLTMVRLLLNAQGTIELWLLLKGAIQVGLAMGVCLYAVNLPYMLLMFRSPFFRQRFRVWLGVKPSHVSTPLP